MKGAGNMQTMQQYITEMGLEYCRPTARTVCSSAAAGGRILFGSMRRQRFVSNAAGHAEP